MFIHAGRDSLPTDTRKLTNRPQRPGKESDVRTGNAFQPRRPCVRPEELQRREIQPARLRRQEYRLHLPKEQRRPRTESPRTARPLERRDERLEHRLRRSPHRNLQPGQNGE